MSPGCSSYGGMPGWAPKNCSSIACHDRPGARSPNSRIIEAFR